MYKRRLKNDAVPSVWPKQNNASLKPLDYLSFLSSPSKPIRASTGSQRLQLEHQRQESEMFKEIEVHTSTDMFDKLSRETLPSRFLFLKTPKLLLVKLEATEDKVLEIKLAIQDNLTFKVFLGYQRISNTSFCHCLGLKSDKINSVTEAINIVTYIGS
uniref:Uncharacterized protein n=1 Tax=Lepeophtheirus salmonis TaxID=72036 RepID=A0A0K2VD07_LEPSM